MQISTFNRIVGLFFVGSIISMLIVVGVIYSLDIDLTNQFSNGGINYTIILVTLMLPVSIFFGSLNDSFTSIFRDWLEQFLARSIVSDSLASRFFINIFGLPGYLDSVRIARKKFIGTMEDLVNHTSDDEDRTYRLLAVATFFKTADAETVQWLTRIFSMYLLFTNYVVLIISTLFLLSMWSDYSRSLFQFFIWQDFRVVLSILVVMYTMFRSIATRYFYSYEIVYRQASLARDKLDSIKW